MSPGPPVTSEGDQASLFQKYGSNWTLQDGKDKLKNGWIWTWKLQSLDLKSFVVSPLRRESFIFWPLESNLTTTSYFRSSAYVPDVDATAHHYGPEYAETYSVLSETDLFIASIWNSIRSRNLTQVVDLIVVSDHGMTSTSNSRLIYLNDLLGPSLFSQLKQELWPNVGIKFKGTEDQQKERMREAEIVLRKASGNVKAFKVYRKEEIPEGWSWKKSERLAELLLIPEIGRSFTSRDEMRLYAVDGVYQPLGWVTYENTKLAGEPDQLRRVGSVGRYEWSLPFVCKVLTWTSPSSFLFFDTRNHGYSPEAPEKSAIFVPSGPSFKQLGLLPSLKNLEIYNLVTGLVGVPEEARAANNGTLDWQTYLIQFWRLQVYEVVYISESSSFWSYFPTNNLHYLTIWKNHTQSLELSIFTNWTLLRGSQYPSDLSR